MKRVTFQNDGLVDIRAVTTFGVSSKETKNPIGYFGTGLKYAIAVLLRLGCRVEMHLGVDRQFVFEVRKTRIRVDDFDVVTMTEYGDEPRTTELAFTTQLGKNWEVWQAFRELWCNALDEGGDVHPDTVPPRPAATTIVVTGEPIVEAYHQRDTIMLTGEPKWRSQGVEIHYRNNVNAYYRGIRAVKLSKKSVLTYNIVGHAMTLTEDRTIAHPYVADVYVRDALAETDDEQLLGELVQAPKDTYEASINFADAELGPALMRMLEGVEFARCHNESLLRAYMKAKGQHKTPRKVAPDTNEEKTLARALDLLEFVGCRVEHYPIVVTDELEDHVLGMAYDRTIFLNRRVFMQGVKMVAGTVYEEYVHLHHALFDETRGMQNYLIDALMTMGEKMKGEPA